MRASLRHHLWSQLRSGRIRHLLRAGLRAAAARGGWTLPGRLAGPLLATFAVTYRCPLACGMCGLPARAEDEMSDAEITRWVDAIAALAPAGLGFTGGEPLLRRATYPAIEQSVRHGMVTHLNTSGLPVTRPNAARLAASGIASINVSIDHPVSERHDALRGRSGSFAAAVRAVSLLAQARAAAGTRLRLQVTMAVSADNLDAVPRLSHVAREAGADSLSLLPVHDFGSVARHSTPLSGDPAGFRPAGVENSREYLLGITQFLAGAITPGQCSAPRTGLYIDPRGDLFPCTPAAAATPRGLPGTPETLAAVFRSGALVTAVPAGRCERCWWNCHRELDIALGRRWRISP